MGFLIQVGRLAAAILVFGIIIMVHELGHFIAAKCMGVKVNEFSLGMGPKLLKFGKKETQYTLRLFPIGGYCARKARTAREVERFGSRKRRSPRRTTKRGERTIPARP